MKTESQLERVSGALLNGAEVSPVTAFRHGWGLRLSAIVYRLRCKGWPIQTHQDHNNGMARYALPKGWKPANLNHTKGP